MSNSGQKFSEALKEWRTVKGLSQKEVGARIGVHRTVISFLENGEQQPSTKYLILFKEKWGVDFSDYVLGENDRPYYGPPRDSSVSHQDFVELINASKEAKKDLIAATELIESSKTEIESFPSTAKKLISQVENLITSAWKKL